MEGKQPRPNVSFGKRLSVTSLQLGKWLHRTTCWPLVFCRDWA